MKAGHFIDRKTFVQSNKKQRGGTSFCVGNTSPLNFLKHLHISEQIHQKFLLNLCPKNAIKILIFFYLLRPLD
jgi:hypothetical protein